MSALISRNILIQNNEASSGKLSSSRIQVKYYSELCFEYGLKL